MSYVEKKKKANGFDSTAPTNRAKETQPVKLVTVTQALTWWRRGDQVILGFMASSRLAWAIWRPCVNNNSNNALKSQSTVAEQTL